MGTLIGLLILFLLVKAAFSVTSALIRVVLALAGFVLAIALIPALLAVAIPFILFGFAIVIVGAVFKAIF